MDIASTGAKNPKNGLKNSEPVSGLFWQTGQNLDHGVEGGVLLDRDPVYLSPSLTIGLHPIIRRELIYLPLSRVSDL